MNSIKINAELLHEAQQQANKYNLDFSDILENFIKKFISNSHKDDFKNRIKITPFVEQLGIDLNLPKDFDEKEAYRKHLEEKYQ